MQRERYNRPFSSTIKYFHFWLDDRLDDDDKRKIMMCLKVIHQFDTLMQKCILLQSTFENTIKPHTVGPYAVQNSTAQEFRILFHR